MNCQTCKYESWNKCAVNPIHCRGAWSKSCKEYEHDESKEIKCSNCVGFVMGKCSLTHTNVSASDKGCGDFMNSEEEEALKEQYELSMIKFNSQIKVELHFDENKSFLKLVLVK